MQDCPQAGRLPAVVQRRHDEEGISNDAHAVIAKHGLDVGNIMNVFRRYRARRSVDFNLALVQDTGHAERGTWLDIAEDRGYELDAPSGRLGRAIVSLNYGESDGIMDEWLKAGMIVDHAGGDIYDRWREDAEWIEGVNVALFWAAKRAKLLKRFIGSLDELGNYRHGRWRRAGDVQDRVSATVGESNKDLDTRAVALVSYSASALGGWTQPVRYSPYPRNPAWGLERFGCEKSWRFAHEGEVHIHARCPIPPREHVKIALLRRTGIAGDEVERYGDVGGVERQAPPQHQG